MSDLHLPPEISDYIVDFLHYQPKTLKRCCLVSKSWVPRTRKHLFREIVFEYTSDLEAWKDTFPDPANSPAYYTRCLSFNCSIRVINAAVEERDYWIQVFFSVVKLNLRHVHIMFSPSKPYIPLLICSLPNLEDLMVTDFRVTRGDDTVFKPSASPPLTGTLEITWTEGVEGLVTQLLDLPSGIHFRKFKFLWNMDMETDVRWVMALVEACSNTLEHIDLESRVGGDVGGTSIDLYKATKLRSVVLRVRKHSVLWVVKALKTITSGHRDLREVTFHITIASNAAFVNKPVNARQTIGDQAYALWMDLDRLLVQLSESGAIRVRVRCWSSGGNEQMRKYVESLLPEVARGGSGRLLDYSDL